MLKFFKRIWVVIVGLFFKRPPSAEKILKEAKEILKIPLVYEDILTKIEEAQEHQRKDELIGIAANYKTAQIVVDIIETTVLINPNGKGKHKPLYELQELRSEIFNLEKKITFLDLSLKGIRHSEYPSSIHLDTQYETLVNNTKVIQDISFNRQLSGININILDKSIGDLESLLIPNPTIDLLNKRIKKKQKREEELQTNIKQKLSELELLISQNKYIKSKELVKTIQFLILPKFEKESSRLVKLKEKLDRRETEYFERKQVEEYKKQEVEAKRIRDIEEEQAAELQKKRAIEESERQKVLEQIRKKELELVALLTKKHNWEEFREILLRNNIRKFYHFTDRKNIPSINKSNGLYSWASCDKKDILIPAAGGDWRSRELDKKHRLQDYVRLSFCNNHPMQWRLKNEEYDLVILEVNIEVAYFEQTCFSDMNATDSSHTHGPNISHLKRVKFSATQKTFVKREDPDFKYHQAEILVRTHIPIEFITNINNYC